MKSIAACSKLQVKLQDTRSRDGMMGSDGRDENNNPVRPSAASAIGKAQSNPTVPFLWQVRKVKCKESMNRVRLPAKHST